MRLLDEHDLDWVSDVVDVVERKTGQPWRIALECLDDTRRLAQPTAPRRFAAVVSAVQRVLGGRARNAKLARATRSLALGPPVFSPAEREARIATTAAALELTSATVEKLLWSDIPRERPIELPAGRPSELEVAALANLQLLQRAICRAHAITIRVWGDSGPLIRAAGTHGLLSAASVENGATVLAIIGPLALCHRTSVYGRALARLVPLLVDCARFELTLEAQAQGTSHCYRVECASPVLLPAVPSRMAASGAVVARLMREVGRLRPELIVGTPEPIAVGTAPVCPDLAITCGQTTRYIELVGFWTTEYLDRKLARYRAGGLDVRVCIDDARSCANDEPPRDISVVPFTKHVAARSVLDGF